MGKGRDFQDMGHCPLLGLLTVPWNCQGTSGRVISLADWGSKSSLVCILVLFDSNWLYVVFLGYVILPKLCPALFPPVTILPGEFLGQRSLAGYSPWVCKESDMTEQLSHYVCTKFPILEKYSSQRNKNDLSMLSKAIHRFSIILIKISMAFSEK